MSKSSGSRMWNALGGKAARACDSCLLKRARWFCAADDAFLCQACDVSVHSANQLAHRHERVRLETSSWHQGFTRKARTPRHAKLTVFNHQLPLVPEINLQDPENEEHLLYRVPVFDTEGIGNIMLLDEFFDEFAGDVKSLLGTGLEEECDSGVGRVENNGIEDFLHAKKLKVEDDCDDQVQALIEDIDGSQVNKRMLLKLNYEAVITSWATQSSPWTNGTRPQFNIDEFMAACLERGSHLCGGVGANDSEREARVSRYREKRRTRLFSKKIRYQVRKLNAEKRPRMKGRFVKTTFHTSSRVKYTT